MVIDANSIGLFLKNRGEENYLGEIHHWLENRRGKLAYFPHEEFIQLDNSPLIEALRLGNRIKLIPKARVEKIQRDIEKAGKHASDDPHILALCLAAGATVVCTEDEALRADIATLPKLKKVRLYDESYYRNKGKHGTSNTMLTPDTCP